MEHTGNNWLNNIDSLNKYGLDLETDDPTLRDKGKVKARGSASVFGLGSIIVTGIYNKGKKKSYDGSGGESIRKLYLDPGVVIIGANICYDIQWDLRELGLKPEDIKCHFIDVSIAESLIDEYQKYSLDELALKYLNEHKGKDKLEEIALNNKMKGDFRQHLQTLWDLGYEEEIREYVLSDADQPCRIWEKQWEIIKAQGLVAACQMNMDMIPVVSAMKYYGVNFDFEQWKKNCAVTKAVYEDLKQDYESKYGEVNINSPKQLAVQFDDFDVPYKMKIGIKGWKVEGRKFKNATDLFQAEELYRQRKTLKQVFPNVAIEKKRLVLYVAKRYGQRTADQLSKMGYEVSLNPCINKSLFTELKSNDKYPIVQDLVQYKQAKNLVDKFLGEQFGRFIVCHLDGKAYPAFIQNKDGSYTITEEAENKNAVFRIHGSFDIVGARQTGRLSGKVPNLQQIASKTVLFAETEKEIDLAKMCRECFIAEKGQFFLKQDYASQENRLAAHFAPGKNGERVRRMYNEDPYLDEHQYAAEVSGLIEEYGAKIGRKFAKNLRFGLSYGMSIARMMITFGWTKEFAENLNQKIADAAPWLYDLMEKIQETVLKRRFIRTLVGRRIHLRKGHDSEAYAFMNYLIQGSASDMTKLASVKVWETHSCELMNLTVHDEDDFSLPCTKAGIKRALEIGNIMETTAKVDVPMLSEPEVGTSWADGVEYDRAFGTREEFITSAVTAIKEGKWEEYRKNAKAFLKREEDDDMTFAEFCQSVEEDEDEEEE